jgi:DNA-binding response OmpR family regulator
MPRIFLVNAFQDESDMYAGFFALRGHEVAVFDAPEMALDAARQAPPDAIVARFPQHKGRMDAEALTAHVRNDDRMRQVAVLVITSVPLSSGTAARIGYDACILLPATPDVLLRAVTTVLRTQSPGSAPL